jgi:hypothetical protein
MLRFAFIKVGIPTADDIPVFMTNVKFKIHGQLFSLQEWVDGVLRGNKKSGLSAKAPFSGKDARKDLSILEFDNRVHFALNTGFTLGCTSSLPFEVFQADKIGEQLE